MAKVKLAKKHRDRIQKWVDALRSGKYKQTTGELKGLLFDDNGDTKGIGYCCLGVAEELRRKATKKPFDWDSHGILSDAGCKYYGLVDEDGNLDNDPILAPRRKIGKRDASELNDNGMSFKQIADRIEAKYLK